MDQRLRKVELAVLPTAGGNAASCANVGVKASFGHVFDMIMLVAQRSRTFER